MSKKPLFFYGWIILAISFITMVLTYGARNSFSVFYVEILDEFGWSRANTAGIFSISIITYGITAPFAGALVDKFGSKRVLLTGGIILTLAIMLCSKANTIYHFYLLFGVVSAIGHSLIGYPAILPLLSNWFVLKRGMVFGILASGWGVSFLAIVPLVQYLTAKFGWRTSFLLIGILMGAILLPLIAIFSHHRPEDMNLLPDGAHLLKKEKLTSRWAQNAIKINKKWVNTSWTLKKAMQTYQFWLIFLTFFCIFGLVENFIVVHQIALMRDAGLSNTLTSSVIAFWGIMLFLGTLGGGFLSDKIGREKTFTLGCLFSILGLFILLLLEKGLHNRISYFYAFFFGLGMGINGPVLGAVIADMFQGKNFGRINGFIVLGFGLGGLIGPWFGGFIFDTTGSYSAALKIAIPIVCVAFILLWIAAPRKIRKFS